MARYNSKDYIPTYGDLEAKRDEANARAAAARERGYRLGEYEISYSVNGTHLVEKITAASKSEAIESLKRSCGMVGWYPTGIDAKTLVEPNIYV